MNATVYSIKEARELFSELIERAALTRESFLVTKFGKPKAMIVPIQSAIQKNAKKKEKLSLLTQTAGIWKQRKDMHSSVAWVHRQRRLLSTRHEAVFG